MADTSLDASSATHTLTPTDVTNIGSMKRNEALVGWLMALPAIIGILGFVIIPFLYAFGFAFTNERLISPNQAEWVGFRNFSRLLTIRTLTLDPLLDEETGEILLDEDGNIVRESLRDFTRNEEEYPQYFRMQELFAFNQGDSRTVVLASDPVFIKALFNTILFVLIVAPVQAGIALMLAILINQPLRGINIFRTIYFMPVVVSMVIVAMLWRFIYDGQNGLLNSLLGAISFGAIEPIDWLANPDTAMPALIAMSIWQGVGFHMVIWLAGLQNIPTTLYEAASVSGANTWQKFRYVTWPGLRSTAIFILIIITMQGFSLYTQVQVMTRGQPLDRTQSVVFQAVIRGFERQDIAGGSAISVIFFLMVLSISLIQAYLTREQAR